MAAIENSTTTANVETPPLVKLIELIRTAWIPQAISVAAELKIADTMKEGAKCCKDIAAELNVHEDNLYRLLRGLSTIGVFREVDHRVFENSPMSELLMDEAGTSREAALSVGFEYHWTSFGHMARSIRTGVTAFESAFDISMFEYFQQNPEINDNFNKVMISLNDVIAPMLAQGYDFNQFASMVDVGGGYGSVSIPVLRAFPHLHGTVFDQPHVVENATRYIAEAGLSDRLEVVGGSFFEEIPSGADLYLLKYILHDWNDEKALQILKTVRAAMKENSKVLLVEHVISGANVPSGATFLDMTMMVMYGGRERSQTEYEQLLEKAGLRLNRVINTPVIDFMEVVAV